MAGQFHNTHYGNRDSPVNIKITENGADIALSFESGR